MFQTFLPFFLWKNKNLVFYWTSKKNILFTHKKSWIFLNSKSLWLLFSTLRSFWEATKNTVTVVWGSMVVYHNVKILTFNSKRIGNFLEAHRDSLYLLVFILFIYLFIYLFIHLFIYLPFYVNQVNFCKNIFTFKNIRINKLPLKVLNAESW